MKLWQFIISIKNKILSGLLIIFIIFYPYNFTISDIISCVGLLFAILSYMAAKNAAENAKSADESAKEAVKTSKNKADNYSDHLLLHSGERLISLMKLALKTEDKQNSVEICDIIRREMFNFRCGIKKISSKQQIKIQDIITFLTRYKADSDSKETLNQNIKIFEDLITNLTHNEDIVNDD